MKSGRDWGNVQCWEQKTETQSSRRGSKRRWKTEKQIEDRYGSADVARQGDLR